MNILDMASAPGANCPTFFISPSYSGPSSPDNNLDLSSSLGASYLNPAESSQSFGSSNDQSSCSLYSPSPLFSTPIRTSHPDQHQNVVPSFLPEESGKFTCSVDALGFLKFDLVHSMRVDVSTHGGIRISNPRRESTLALSGCATNMAMVHPKGRILQYMNRIEVQARDEYATKYAKMYPKGVSFSGSNCALVYLVDAAGVRSTTDNFYDVYAENIADSVFLRSNDVVYSPNPERNYDLCSKQLHEVKYFRAKDGLHVWKVNQAIEIRQTEDGFVTVERRYGNLKFLMKSSPANGKIRMESAFLYATASLGPDSHLFVRSNSRRIHYNGSTFVVRNGTQSAGFDEQSQLKLW